MATTPVLLQADGGRPMQLDGDMLVQLRSYAEAFLQGSYNILMGSVRKELEPGLNISRLSSDDFLRFFRVANFFTTFVRLQQVIVLHCADLSRRVFAAASVVTPGLCLQEEKRRREKQGPGDNPARPDESPFSCISATMGWETFHLVQSLWLTAIELPAVAAASTGEKWELQVRWYAGGLHVAHICKADGCSVAAYLFSSMPASRS